MEYLLCFRPTLRLLIAAFRAFQSSELSSIPSLYFTDWTTMIFHDLIVLGDHFFISRSVHSFKRLLLPEISYLFQAEQYVLGVSHFVFLRYRVIHKAFL